MKVGKLLVFAAVLGLTAGAGAATVHTGTDFTWDISAPVAVGGGAGAENLIAFTLTITNISGNSAKNPQAFDGAPDPNNPPGQTGIETTGGSLIHHEQAIAGFGHTKSPDIDYWTGSGAPAPSVLDSYFLQSNPASVFAPDEDDIKLHQPYSAETAVYAAYNFRTGWTDKMQGTFAMQGTNSNSYWDLVYLVVPCDTVIRIDAQVSGSDGVKEDFDFTFTASCGEPIPVPAALPLGFAGLLLAIRRRVA